MSVMDGSGAAPGGLLLASLEGMRSARPSWKVLLAAAAAPACGYLAYRVIQGRRVPIEKRFEQSSLDIEAHKLPPKKRRAKGAATASERDLQSENVRSSLVPDSMADIEEKGIEIMTPESAMKEMAFMQKLPLPAFRKKVGDAGFAKDLERVPPTFICANLGLYCNQSCNHCHVDSSPLRKESMTVETADRVLQLLRSTPSVHTVDLTGGAPELNPAFEHIVRGVRRIGSEQKRKIRIIDRCNLTVLCEPGMENLADFLAEQDVTVIASLPCYSESNCDKQRGRKVFVRSIEGLKQLNEKGYGKKGGKLQLDLVYNPLGAFLPPPQEKLEKAYKEKLMADHGIFFGNLFTLTNMPIRRFFDFLSKESKLEEYMDLLERNFNGATVSRLMCRDTVSISWNGQLYDCDFNMQLGLELQNSGKDDRLPKKEISTTLPALSVWDINSYDDSKLQAKKIRTAAHCYGCTAGQGSS